jgi:hypothetical protein
LTALDELKKNPNFDLSIEIPTKILQIRNKINSCLVVCILDNETCGAILLGDPHLTDQGKINTLLQTMAKLKIPFQYLEKYGNLDQDKINVKGEIKET